jgi:Leucine-rich repeat (LRR) protein
MRQVILPGLEELSINFTGDDLGGAPIASFAPNLKRFSLINATNISDSDIVQLENLRNLQNLDLRSPHLSHNIIEKLESLRTLEGLSLDFADMRLAQFDRLPESLTSLSLDQSRLSPESFESLFSLKQLKRLVISDVDSCITPAMVDALQEALPNCEIVR